MLPEPIAAALHYVISSPMQGDVETKYAVVCDIGGGTTDLAMIFIQRMRRNSGKYAITFSVLATEHDGNLGGNDIDENLFKKIVSKHGEDKVLFATDCPWRDIKDDLEVIHTFNLPRETLDKILYKNAIKLLGI